MFTANNTQRVFMFNVAVMVMIGIALTGFSQVHWFAYVLPGALLFAAASGFCLGIGISKKIVSILGIKE